MVSGSPLQCELILRKNNPRGITLSPPVDAVLPHTFLKCGDQFERFTLFE